MDKDIQSHGPREYTCVLWRCTTKKLKKEQGSDILLKPIIDYLKNPMKMNMMKIDPNIKNVGDYFMDHSGALFVRINDDQAELRETEEVLEDTRHHKEHCSQRSVETNIKNYEEFSNLTCQESLNFNDERKIREHEKWKGPTKFHRRPYTGCNGPPKNRLKRATTLSAPLFVEIVCSWVTERATISFTRKGSDSALNCLRGPKNASNVRQKKAQTKLTRPLACVEPNAKPSQILCKKLCFEAVIWQRCQCWTGMNPAYGESIKNISTLNGILPGKEKESIPKRSCNPLISPLDKICMEIIKFEFMKGELKCKHCHPECSEMQYSTTVTTNEDNLRYHTIVQNIRGKKSGDDLCINHLPSDSTADHNLATVRLHLYLDSMANELVTESPAFSFETLVCNMGGNLGLFIGMSLITILEVLEFIFDIVLYIFRGKRKNQTDATKMRTQPTVVFVMPQDASNLDMAVSRPKSKDADSQTTVMLQPFDNDTEWRHRALRKQTQQSYFNKIFEQ
ncbi:unnamed protein product, partial [Meganyctiphanes norvegica]